MEFDLAVLLFVVVVMPLGLMLMRSKSTFMKWFAFLCVLSGLLYVGIFEHYRMHHPRVTSGGLKQAVVTSLQGVPWDETTWMGLAKVNKLDLDGGMRLSEQSVAVLEAMRSNLTLPSDEEPHSPATLLVHLAHPHTGLVWFKHLFRLMSGVTCSSDNRMTCLDWSSGSGSHEIDKGATLVQVVNPMPLQKVTKPMRAIFTARDPRDLVVAAYFQHYNSRESYVHMPRKEYGSRSIYQELHRMSKEDGLNVEIERLNAPTHGNGQAGSYARSFDAFVALRNTNVTFIKYEDIAKHASMRSPVACALIGQWYNLDPTHLKAFVQSCVEAYDELVVRTSADQKSLNNEGQCTLVACPPETPIPVGIWKHHFSSKNVLYFNSLHSRLLKTLGYEQDWLGVN